MRLSLEVRVPPEYDKNQIQSLVRQLQDAINGVAEGRITYRYNAMTAAPTGGMFAKGDFVANSSPSELGAGGSKYVITGWICSVGGTPGTWLQCRSLTGN